MPSAVVGTAVAAAMVSGSSKAAATISDPPTVDAAVPVVAAVVTDVAGAVSAAAEQARIDAGRRIRLALLPESVFSSHSSCQGGRGGQQQQRRTAATTTARKNGNINSSTESGIPFDGFPGTKAHAVSPPTAAAATVGEGVNIGVREALDRWALQT